MGIFRHVLYIVRYISSKIPLLLLIDSTRSLIVRPFYNLKPLYLLKIAPPFPKTCPNEARLAAERWHSNIQYCVFYQSTNDNYMPNDLAQLTNNTGNPFGPGSSSGPTFAPKSLQIPGSS
jgi:hypothetical protein